MSVQFHEGVPIPPRNRQTAVSVHDFERLGVGDSLSVDVPKAFRHKPTIWAGTNRIRNAAYTYGKRTGRKFTVRCISGKIWVWRVS